MGGGGGDQGGSGAGADRGGAGSLASWFKASYEARLGAAGKELPPFASVLVKNLLNAAGAAIQHPCEVLVAGNCCRRYRRDEGDGGGSKDYGACRHSLSKCAPAGSM